MYVCLYAYIYECTDTYVYMYTCMCTCTYICVAGMSMNAAGMSIHPFPMKVLCFGGKIPSLLNF